MSRRLINEVVDGAAVRVLVERGQDGVARTARFDLSGLPRVDALLTGRPVAQVPSLVERLCGLCPAAHHLAGVRALESLCAGPPLTASADAVRRLLHHGSALDAHGVRLAMLDRDQGLLLKRFGKAVMAAAGSPGHFPVTAVPGGVSRLVDVAARDELATDTEIVLAAAVALAETALGQPVAPGGYGGADVALVDDDGRPDLLGTRLRVVASDGVVVEAGAPTSAWDALVAEASPGDAAPRPYLVPLGPDGGGYRVGPVAQLRVGPLGTPAAAGLQERWLDASGGAPAARAVMAVHAVEAVRARLGLPELVSGDPGVAVPPLPGPGEGVGWVDGPRGLLVHRYRTDAAGTVTRAVILTPTAQNEPWLADLLRGAVGAAATSASQAVEQAIREADPCLPCTSAPIGQMDVQVEAI